LLAARVIAVEAMLKGATFIEVYRGLHRDHGFSRRGAFGIAARVFRSGGLAKDAIYLRGLGEVMGLVRAGASLEPFWLGKIAARHAPAIQELLQRGLVKAPKFIPLFLSADSARQHMAGLKKAESLETLLSGA
jgi:hypothetical protein